MKWADGLPSEGGEGGNELALALLRFYERFVPRGIFTRTADSAFIVRACARVTKMYFFESSCPARPRHTKRSLYFNAVGNILRNRSV